MVGTATEGREKRAEHVVGGKGGQVPSLISLYEYCSAVPPHLTLLKNMKRRWTKLAVVASVTVATTTACLLAWFVWPTSGTLVGQAARSDIPGIKRSLLFGADINGYSRWGWHRENKGDTPLASAVQYGNLDTVGFLLTRGADPNQRDGSGMPPICWAAIQGRLDVSKALVEGGAKPGLPDVDHYGKPEKTALDYARTEGHNDLAAYLLSEQDARGNGR
ncbi:MAG: ankyrin repeat domain-containing protein [Akkermansiaceae bacterium]|nr:ankyrin repeat domain-containing protein [Akkermansiaceae bacterium]